jgi:hypothetical protein
MDTSEQYIKMCDCKEIQNQEGLGSTVGSFHARLNPHPDLYPQKYYTLVGCESCTRMCMDEIWLPRQDQLQGMISHDKSGALLLLSLFSQSVYRWKTSYKMQFAKSMEQLWLAYVMYEKFNKKWNWNEDKWEVVT